MGAIHAIETILAESVPVPVTINGEGKRRKLPWRGNDLKESLFL